MKRTRVHARTTYPYFTDDGGSLFPHASTRLDSMRLGPGKGDGWVDYPDRAGVRGSLRGFPGGVAVDGSLSASSRASQLAS